jgi:hypothetical protein
MKNSLTYSLRAIFAFVALACAISSASAEDAPAKKAPKPPSAADLAKYDTNKDGKLDKDERAKMMADKKAAAAAAAPAAADSTAAPKTEKTE